jgi:hypothetical protein
MSANTTIEVLHLLAPLVALATMAASHAVLCRIRPDAAILNLLVVAGFAGLGGLFAMQLLALLAGQTLGSAFAAMMLVDGPIYACLAYGYANFVNLGHASVRIRIYRELLDSPQGIQVSELRAKYDEAGMLSTRLRRMLEAEDLAFDGSVYRLNKARLLAISNVIFGLKKAVLGRHSEFNS